MILLLAAWSGLRTPCSSDTQTLSDEALIGTGFGPQQVQLFSLLQDPKGSCPPPRAELSTPGLHCPEDGGNSLSPHTLLRLPPQSQFGAGGVLAAQSPHTEAVCKAGGLTLCDSTGSRMPEQPQSQRREMSAASRAARQPPWKRWF